ncbi:non-specific lipid-transfer protein 1-like [Salvia divinorum]|uniref:Non-specific lipid-transfer protein 1-like n=1 Tax=Salvia divinorum TaxID=28513 RepID=A0ABD1HYJ6_SALDI
MVGRSSTLWILALLLVAASKLNDMVHSKVDLKDLCSCLKQAAAALLVIADRAKSLPGQCHIQVPVPLDPNVDCSR